MKRFSRYAKKRFESLSDQLSNFGTLPEPEVLHKIRLEVKKIKTILNVTEFCINGFDKPKNYFPFRSIFRMAGEIRQADVLDRLLITYKINLVRDPSKKIPPVNDNLVVTFQNELPQFLEYAKRGGKKLKEDFKEVKRSCLEKYLELRKEELKGKLYPRLNQRELHKTRKTIKELLYLSPLMRKSGKKPDPFYNELQILIGQWHDKQMVVAMLDSKKYSAERKLLKTECQSDIKKIKGLLNRFYQTDEINGTLG